MPTVLIGGGTGLIGQRLSQLLTEKGYSVNLLSRKPRPNAVYPTYQWNVAEQYIEEKAIQEADFVINLAGAGIADKPWSAARKQLIIDSRTETTALLLNAFERLGKAPEAFLSSAAIGLYGERGEEEVTEEAAPGTGFLAESCIAWEDAIHQVAEANIRTAYFRIGIVLSTKGGALPKISLPLHFFLGTYFGNGAQWYSWAHIDDICNMFIWGIENPNVSGAYNAVSPNPFRNKAFTRTVGQAMNKPHLLLPVPSWGLRLGMGEMADVVLNSTKVSSEKIAQAGFQFEYPKLGTALTDLFQRKI